MSTDIQLNPAGQLALAGAASIVANGICHPLSTIQSCLQARQPIPAAFGLFRGLTAICAVDATAFGVAYVANDRLQQRFGAIGAVLAATALATLPAAIGEGAMANRQTNNLSYRQAEIWRRALRIRGMGATFGRDLPWNIGIFYLPPIVANWLPHRLSPMQREAIATILIGATVGFCTTPLAALKTQIHTSLEHLTLYGAVQKLIHPIPTPPDGVFAKAMRAQAGLANKARIAERLFIGGASRTGYVCLTLCLTKGVYHYLPGHMPKQARKE